MADYPVMEKEIDRISGKIKSPKVRQMFLNCFYSTLKTTTEIMDDGTTYVFTGDIPAMWLRDSSAQVTGYLPFASRDEKIKQLIRGLIRRQFKYIKIDPYANAFNRDPNGRGHKGDVTDFDSPWVWERKYEVDSLCYPLWLCSKYFAYTGDAEIFDEEFAEVAGIIMDLFEVEQYHFEKSGYFHHRPDVPEQPTLVDEGRGRPVAYTGMTWSGYRPSDDPCEYNYLIPSNMFAVVVLRELEKVFSQIRKDEALKEKAAALAAQIQSGIEKFGTVEHPDYGKIYAYETDGLGNYNLMDDANVPSLLSLPYLGYLSPYDPVYKNTRKFVLSRDNPYYFEGNAARGVGSPHTPDRHIWHIGIIMQLLTSTNPDEIKECFETLINTDAGCGVMHESFHADDPQVFTREWFAWANTLFTVALLELYEGKTEHFKEAAKMCDIFEDKG